MAYDNPQPRPLYIFDIDGTLCDITHRLHFIQGDKPDWDAFHRACNKDVPKKSVIALMDTLRGTGAEVWLFSGRSDIVRTETENWLHHHTSFSAWLLEENPAQLSMRQEGDYTEDHLLKESWLSKMLLEDVERLVCVFDDRQRVVDMWRKNGVTCMQVAPGDF